MSEFLVPIIETHYGSSLPIILIDVSGSTDTNMKSDKTIRVYEFEIAKQLIEKYGSANVVCWSTTAFSLGTISSKDLEGDSLTDIYKRCKKISSGTHLMCGLNLIQNEWLSDKSTELIIITDGEISDSSKHLSAKLNELSGRKIVMKIIAVEVGKKNYLTSQCNVGNALYRMIRENGMTRLVNKFLIYNDLDTEFVNFSNPIVPDEYIPFREYMFHRADFGKFIKYFVQLVNELKTKYPMSQSNDENLKQILHGNDSDIEFDDDKDEEIIKNTDTNKMMYLKLAHDISLSIYHLTKSKSYQEQVGIIDTFSSIFKDVPVIYTDIRKLMLEEVNNHMTGRATTFTSLKKNKYIDIENRNILLMEDTCKSIIDESKFMDNLYKMSFPIRSTDGITIIRSTDILSSIKIDKSIYRNSGIMMDKYVIPVMFKPEDGSVSKRLSAKQWLLMHYGRVLNLSPSNENLYYYFLSDAYSILSLNKDKILSDVRDIYESYVNIVLTHKDDGDSSVIEKLLLDGMVKLPYGIFESCINYIGLKIKPLTLFYLLTTEFILPLITDGQSKNKIITDLQNFCLNDVRSDFGLDQNIDVNWQTAYDQFNSLLSVSANKLNIIDVVGTTKFIRRSHKINGTDIECASRVVEIPTNICEICGSDSDLIIVKPKLTSNTISFPNDKKQFFFDTTKHINLGMLDGEKKGDMLIIPDVYILENDSVQLSNMMIVDPISSSAMRIRNKDEFNTLVSHKYPFIKELDMSNIALCGGFVRAVLLKQQMKDFDFFFYGIQDYNTRFHKLVTDLVKNVRKHDPELKFGMFFKPMFNVFEIVAFKDPSNHINEEFTLDNFDKYDFLNLRKYNREEMLDENDKYYFEDNDEKGIKMIYRFQFILCRYNSIFDIIHSFDMFPSKVAYDGETVYFTEKSLMAYRFMINEICYDGGSDLFKHRLSKYFKYGFSIVFPPNNREWRKDDFDNKYNHGMTSATNENVGPLTFKVRNMLDNIIYINHNSNIEKMLERNEQLEKDAMDKGKALYISSLFCSFVSLLRYVKINGINYIFPQYKPEDVDINLPLEGEEFVFKTGKVKIDFIDIIATLYNNRDWYNTFADSMLLTKYEH